MPMTEFQERVARLLSGTRSEESYLAGGAALHLEPNTLRYSADLDYFHDSEKRVAEAFEQDRRLLEREGLNLIVEISMPGYVKATVVSKTDQTEIEWAHDSAWRFVPAVADPRVGFRLHPVDLAINKVLALAGRDEPRDFLDVLEVDRDVVSLGALCWASAGKDPGFSPLSLVELLKRRGRYRPEDFARLRLTRPVNLIDLKTRWLTALEEAERFVRSRPPEEHGCLYWDSNRSDFVTPSGELGPGVVPHFGRPGGVLPRVLEDA